MALKSVSCWEWVGGGRKDGRERRVSVLSHLSSHTTCQSCVEHAGLSNNNNNHSVNIVVMASLFTNDSWASDFMQQFLCIDRKQFLLSWRNFHFLVCFVSLLSVQPSKLPSIYYHNIYLKLIIWNKDTEISLTILFCSMFSKTEENWPIN